jgi:hypothetical protein
LHDTLSAHTHFEKIFFCKSIYLTITRVIVFRV